MLEHYTDIALVLLNSLGGEEMYIPALFDVDGGSLTKHVLGESGGGRGGLS